jgi:hypothetical protein
MKTIGLCTHFLQTDEWAFEYALNLVKSKDWQLNICHWLHSPYRLRRDMVPKDLFFPGQPVPITSEKLTKLEYQLRHYFDEKLGDFTNVAFKLCEGMYQVELVRCFRQNLLDLVVMGYLSSEDNEEPGALPLEEFAMKLSYPLVIVGHKGPNTFLINSEAALCIEELAIPEACRQILEVAPVM